MHELDFQTLDSLISRALREDVGFGDITTQAIVDPALQTLGEFVAKQDFILAGWPVATRVFQQLSGQISADSWGREGASIAKGSVFGTVKGPAAALLSGERVALNFLQRLSGIAT